MGDWYNGGTIAVENGSASIVGTTTLFQTKVKVGDALLTLQSDTLRINQVTAIDDDNNATIDPPWSGTTQSGLVYQVVPTSPDWGEVSTVARDLSNFLANLATFFPTDGKPTDDEGGDGSFAVDPNSTPPKLYLKSSGSWDNGTSLGGPMGATGAGYGGTSTDTKTLVNSGSMSWNTQTGLAWQNGSRIRAASATAPTTKWMEFICTGYAAGVLTGTITDQGPGTGSASDWTFSAAGIHGEKGDKGDPGAQGNPGNTGATGLGYGAQSTTSRAIANTGTMTWNIGLNKAFQNGDLVKCVVPTDPSQWMKGIVSGYTAGVLSVDINEKGPSSTGTFASWNIGLAGETGPTGAKGDKGDAGAAGAAGSILTATSASSVTPAIGDKTFTLDADANLLINQRVRAASASTPGNFVSGLVKSINHSTLALVVTIDLLGPSTAAASDWNISVTGEKGDQGPAGGFGTLAVTKGNIPAADGSTYGVVSFGSDGNILQADSTQSNGIASRAMGAALAVGDRVRTDVASASTCDIGAANTDYVNITGTTTITSFGTRANKVRRVRFDNVLTLTYNGTSLILPGLANIVTAAGDEAEFVSDGLGNWKCRSYTPASFSPKKLPTSAGSSGQPLLSAGSSSPMAFGALDISVAANATVSFTSYTPTITSVSGTLTSTSVGLAAYIAIGKLVWVTLNVTIVTNGTGGGGVIVSLPIAVSGTAILAGRENAVSGKMLQALCASSSATVFFYDNTYPGANSANLIFSGWYRSP